jgi:hypothetical protein
LAPTKTECEATRATTSCLNNKTLATNKQKQQQAMTYNKNKHLAAMVATAAAKAKREKYFRPKWAKPGKDKERRKRRKRKADGLVVQHGLHTR